MFKYPIVLRTAFSFAAGWLLWSVLLLPGNVRAATFTVPMMQGQDPEVEFRNGLFNLVQSDGCNIRLHQSATIGGLVSATDQIIYSPGCSNLWAPEIHWFNTNWFIYYSIDTGSSGNERVNVAQSTGTNIAGPYTERGVLFNSFWNIDGSVFAATNGQLYFIFSGNPSGNQNIYIAPMSNPYTLSGTPVLISQPTQSWETVGASPAVNEGPFGFTHNGRTYIDYSASGCWTDSYCLGLLTLTGTNLMDPAAWTKTGPVFSQQPGAYGPGHNGIFTDASGQYWNIYHANNLSGQGCGGYRQLRVQRVAWDANGLPVFGTPVPIASWITDDTNFLTAQFLLNETGGTNAGNQIVALQGNLNGSPVWRQPGLHFNGTNSYVDCGASVGNDVQNTLTLTAWIRPDSFTDWAGIVCKGTNTEPYALQIWGDGSLRFTANFGSPSGGVGGSSWNSTAKLATNQWQRVAVTYDGATIRFYINGVLDANQPAATLRFGVVNEPLTIGADLPGGDEYFQGTIADVRVYGRALGTAEIQALPALPAPGLIWNGLNNGSPNGNWDLTTTNWLQAGLTPASYVDAALLTFNDSAAGTTTVNIRTNVTPGSLTISNNALSYVFTGPGSITNNALLKLGSGRLTLAITNTFGSSTPSQILNGTVVLAAPTTFNGEGELWLGNSTNSGASLLISNTTVNVTNNYFAIGRAGGTVGNVYNVTLTNANLNVAHWSCGWDGALAGNAAYQNISVTGNSVVTDIGAGNTGFLLGESAGSISTLTLANTSVISNPVTYFDVGQGGTTTLALKDSASLSAGGDFNIGDSGGSVGIVNLTGSPSLTANTLFIGSANAAGSSANGTINQTNGTVTTLSTGDGTLIIGGRSSATTLGVGVYNLRGGTLNMANGGNFWVGGYGTGTLNVSGGTATLSGYVSVGRMAGGTGALNLSAGTVAQTNAARSLLIGESGTGTATISGTGQLTVSGTQLTLGANSTGIATVNLNGGTITVPKVVKGSGSGTFNFNGGTLRANASSTTFLTGLTAANVQSGGAVIDDGGYAITIGQALANQGGGLTKNGTGTLTLTAADIYAGATVVNQGTLLVNGSLTTGQVIVTNNATLGGTGVITGAVTVASGATLSPGVTLGTLTVSNNLTLAGNLRIEINKSLSPSNDLTIVTGNRTNTGTGTVTVTNEGPAFAVGDTFKLFSRALVGGSTLTIAPSPGTGLNWVNQLAVNGAIAVAAISQVPTNINYSLTSGRLNLAWPADHTGWRLLMQTGHLNLGFSQNTNDWATVAGSTLISATNFLINQTNASEFYRLAYP